MWDSNPQPPALALFSIFIEKRLLRWDWNLQPPALALFSIFVEMGFEPTTSCFQGSCSTKCTVCIPSQSKVSCMFHKQSTDILLTAGMYYTHAHIYTYFNYVIHVHTLHNSRTVAHTTNNKHPIIELLSPCYVNAT